MQQRNLDPKALYQESTEEEQQDGELFPIDTSSIVQRDPKSLELLTDLRNFLALKSVTSGGAGTDELLAEFGDRVGPQQSAIFKAMLKEVAVLHKGTTTSMTAPKVWKLKPAFR
jgi:hypothetical protein